MTPKKRILFLAEAVTLAHVARPLVLAAAASEAGHETIIACDPRYDRFVRGGPWDSMPLRSIGSETFLRALSKGKPFYDVATLQGYVEDDMALLRRVEPDLVVGDFRLSLSVSARLLGIPYATVANAYWSPYAHHKTLPMPVLPFTRLMPLPLAQFVFDTFSPLVSRQFCAPLNQVRKSHGLSPLPSDLHVVYTDADHVLYADIPSLFPTTALPANHRYLGPLLWAPANSFPEWWDDLATDRPLIYLTIGSSGPPEFTAAALDTLSSLPVSVIASTAEAPVPSRLAPNVHVAPYIPGIDAAARSDLMICNGGSLSTQQALCAGVPVLGVVGNMDQFFNMRNLVEAGAGSMLRTDRTTPAKLRRAVEELLTSPSHAAKTREIRAECADLDAGRAFCAFVDELSV